jgi:hypothetical protein
LVQAVVWPDMPMPKLAESAQPRSGRHTYVTAGMRFARGTSASGQPEWITEAS